VIRLDDVREAQLPSSKTSSPRSHSSYSNKNWPKFQEELRAKAKVE